MINTGFLLFLKRLRKRFPLESSWPFSVTIFRSSWILHERSWTLRKRFWPFNFLAFSTVCGFSWSQLRNGWERSATVKKVGTVNGKGRWTVWNVWQNHVHGTFTFTLQNKRNSVYFPNRLFFVFYYITKLVIILLEIIQVIKSFSFLVYSS